MKTLYPEINGRIPIQNKGILTMIPALVLVVLLGGGCISASPGSSTWESLHSSPARTLATNPPLSGYPAQDPASVYITSPDFDGGIRAGNVTVTVEIRNFSVVNGSGRPTRAREGHILYFLDVPSRTEPGFPALTPDGRVRALDQPRCTWNNVPPGTHTFSVELVNNDNIPLVPAVIDAVDVTAVGKEQVIATAGMPG